MIRKLILAFCAVLMAGIWFVTLGGWRVVRIGTVVFRYHVLTGRTEIQDQGQWRNPFGGVSDGLPISQASLKNVQLTDLAWGVGGMLVGKATVSPDNDIVGRLGISIRILEPNGTRVRERTLRQNVRWLAGSSHWFVLDTGLTTPEPRQRSLVTLEALN